MENFSTLLTKISTISGVNVLSPNPGVSLKLRPVGGGEDIVLTDNGGVAVYKGTIPTGRYKIIINDVDKTNTYGEYVSFDGTISANVVVTGVFAVERIPDLPVTKIINLLTYIQDNISLDMSKVVGLLDALANRLALTGGTMTGNINMNTHKISMLQSPTDINDAATKGYVDLTTVSSAGDTMSGELNMGGNAIKGLPAQDGTEPATDAASVALITGTNSYIHENFLRKTGNIEQVMNNYITFMNDVWFGNALGLKLPHSHKTPSEPTELTTKKYVDKTIQDYITGHVTAYQQSPTIIRVIHGTSAIEPNRVYPTLQDAIAAAEVNASETNQFLILVEDNADEFISIEDVKPYIHIASNNGTNKILLHQGTYSVLSRGTNILRNINFLAPVPSRHNFENIIFENCAFTVTTGFIKFVGCEFKGINTFNVTLDNAFTLENCVGYPIITNVVPILTGTNSPYFFNNKIYNTKINGSLIVADDTATTLFDADGVIKIQHKAETDAGSDSIGFDETKGRLYYKDSGNNIHYFVFE